MKNNHPSTRKDQTIRTYIGLLLLTICGFAVMYSPQPMYNTICQALDVNKATACLLVSVFMLSLAISPLCVGLLLSKIGTRVAIKGAVLLLGLSGVGIAFAPNFWTLFGIRCFEALLVPVLFTSIMTSIVGLFRHLDMNRAMAGYISCTLVGALCGRILGGICAQYFGWRETLVGFCLASLLAFALIRKVPEVMQVGGGIHSLKEYMSVFRTKGVTPLIYVEACGIFVFAAVGNLLAFRVAELNNGASEGLVGVMYIGYSVGVIASLAMAPMLRFFGKAMRMIIAGSLIYVASVCCLTIPSLWGLFGALWGIALGEFMIHALAPSIVNRLATGDGHCDKGMVNGLFLACYYIGGVIGSYFPGLLYTHFGWMACCAAVIGVQVSALLTLLYLGRKMPDLH